MAQIEAGSVPDTQKKASKPLYNPFNSFPHYDDDVFNLQTSDGTGKRSDAFDRLIEFIPEVREFEADNGPCANVKLNPLDWFKRLTGIFPHIPHFPFCRKNFIDDADSEGNGDTCNFYLPNGQCGDQKDSINPNELLADVPDYYFFEGGLTTPPCSESVVWVVAKEPREVSFFYPFVVRSLETQREDEKIGKFGNLRPLQDLEGRKFYRLRFGYRYWKNHSVDQIDASDADVSDADGAGGPLAALGIQ